MSPLRIAGFALVGVSILFMIANIWYWLIGVGGGLSLYDVWLKFGPSSLNMAQRYMWSGLWNGLQVVLSQPAWIVVGIVGLLCIGLGGKKVEE
ncbi:MAG TPA: hypothetical protein VFE34_24550 [Dongiaceae bacterium]|jgi:uncharacterized membrane protein YuzA (DUF378 family)|nr:hypothetical protein [Dongiaceae bacterium]